MEKKEKDLNFIMGKNAIKEVLKYKKDNLIEVFSIKSLKNSPLVVELVKKGIKVKFLNKNDLDRLVDSTSHQNFIAKIKKRKFLNLEDFLRVDKEESLVLMLDNISDPRNMGSIIRTAECFNVDCLVFSKNRGSDITPTVSKTSCGASEILPIIRVSNLYNTILEFKEKGFEIVSADSKEPSKDISEFKMAKKTVLIVGSEEKGVSFILKKSSDYVVKINMLGKIESLNVSQATAILLFFMRLKRRPA